MRVRLWGARGSIATPGAGTIKYGGNTSCAEMVTDGGVRFILDCGTGARALGLDLLKNGPKPLVANIMLTHTHWDHIQGFPFLAPLFIPGNQISVFAPKGGARSLAETLAGQMEYTYFPVELSQLPSNIHYIELDEGEHSIAGVSVTTQYLNHPTMTLGYRLEADNVSVAYVTDHEPFSETLWRSEAEPGRIDSILHSGDKHHAEFMTSADLVLHDAQYTAEEYPAKKNWGHSTFQYVVEVAACAGVKELWLIHHDPVHDDAFLDRVEVEAREIAMRRGSSMKVACGREGFDEVLKPCSAAPHVAVKAGMQKSAARILIADDDEDLRLLARKALLKQGYEVTEAVNGIEALDRMREAPPDLLLLDVNMPQLGGLEVLKAMRAESRLACIPVVILTAANDEETTRAGFATGAADYVTKPFSIPQLAARIKICLARS